MPPGMARQPLCYDKLSPPNDRTDTRVHLISPRTRKLSESSGVSKPIMGVDNTGCAPAPVNIESSDASTAPGSTSAPAEDPVGEEEVEEGRVPRTRKFPGNMSPEELRQHSLTHIPYHPGCRCCVAGRKRDHKHPRRDRGPPQTHVYVEDANGSSISADYFFPRDKPGEKGLTALAIVDNVS